MPKEQEKEKTVIDKLNQEVDNDKLSEDDLFENLLNEKVDLEKDNNDDDNSRKKTDDLNKEDNEPTREELLEQIATLEKEAKGRLTDTVKSRQEKAQFKQELTQLKSAVSSLLDKKQELEKEPLPLEDPKRKIEFEDDESAFVDLSPVKTAIESESEKTQKQIDELRQAELVRVAKEQYDKTVNEIINLDQEKYNPAYSELQKIMDHLMNVLLKLRTEQVLWMIRKVELILTLDLI